MRKTRAAVLSKGGTPWEITELDLDEPGATHASASAEEAQETIVSLTRGQLADKVICTVGEMDNEVVKAAVNLTGKAGTIVVAGARNAAISMVVRVFGEWSGTATKIETFENERGRVPAPVTR